MAKDMFTTGFTVEEKHLKQPWLGGRNGIYFRCMMCGHKFVVGDHCQWFLITATATFMEDGARVRAPNVMACAPCIEECRDQGRSVQEVWVDVCRHVYNDHWYFVIPPHHVRRTDTMAWDSGGFKDRSGYDDGS